MNSKVKYQTKLIATVIVSCAISFFFFEKTNLYGQNSLIQGSVKISICGDEIVEGFEDCEPQTFNQMMCSDLGYEGGEVYCDVSCSYDLYECIIPEPPTPPPPTEDEIIENEIERIINRQEPIIIVSPSLPFLKLFDSDKNGIIDKYEFIESVKLWGSYWREYRFGNTTGDLSCDLNEDGVCDIVDLSVLLYHTK